MYYNEFMSFINFAIFILFGGIIHPILLSLFTKYNYKEKWITCFMTNEAKLGKNLLGLLLEFIVAIIGELSFVYVFKISNESVVFILFTFLVSFLFIGLIGMFCLENIYPIKNSIVKKKYQIPLFVYIHYYILFNCGNLSRLILKKFFKMSKIVLIMDETLKEDVFLVSSIDDSNIYRGDAVLEYIKHAGKNVQIIYNHDVGYMVDLDEYVMMVNEYDGSIFIINKEEYLFYTFYTLGNLNPEKDRDKFINLFYIILSDFPEKKSYSKISNLIKTKMLVESSCLAIFNKYLTINKLSFKNGKDCSKISFDNIFNRVVDYISKIDIKDENSFNKFSYLNENYKIAEKPSEFFIKCNYIALKNEIQMNNNLV